MKTYVVTYIEKYGGTEHQEIMEVHAVNAAEARKKCVELNYEHTGRHAFRPWAIVKKDEQA